MHWVPFDTQILGVGWLHDKCKLFVEGNVEKSIAVIFQYDSKKFE
jgi:hypothetical protein